jgi:hypothetical protein
VADSAARSLERGHEPDQPRLRGIVVAALAILGVIVIAIIASYLLVNAFAPPRAALQLPPLVVGAPRLQASPEGDRAAFERDKRSDLHEYAWVDRAHGVVRIPIEQAVTLLVQRQRKGAP